MAKYIEFVLAEHKPKTNVWNVQAKEDGAFLGIVKWSGGWRCYIFEPDAETIYEKQCLRDIAEFLERETQAVRDQWRKPQNVQV